MRPQRAIGLVRHRRSVGALTLIELLIATSLIALLVTVATTAFVQMRGLARRIEMRQQLHNSARLVFERLSWELSSLMQGSAIFATSSAAPSPGSVELVFLRGKFDNLDFMTGAQYGAEANSLTDLVWSRWHWDGADANLTLAASSADRTWFADANWTLGTKNYRGAYFRNLPTPQRVVQGGSAATTLNLNSYGSGSTDDIGDYQNLLNNAVPIAANCSAFALEVVCQDGSSHPITSAANASYTSNGLFVDGRGGSDLSGRPRLIRIRFTLTEPRNKLDGSLPDSRELIAEDFSFSFLVPALAPGP